MFVASRRPVRRLARRLRLDEKRKHMSAIASPVVKLLSERIASASPSPPAPVAFNYTQTDSFVALLQQLGASLLVSTYKANKLLAVRASGGGLSTLVRTFDKPMGLAVDARRLAIGTRKEVWFLRNAPDIAPRVEPAGQHDACYLPRSSHVTGDIGVHEMAWARTGSRTGPRWQLGQTVVSKTPKWQGVVSCGGAGVANDTTTSDELWIVNTRFSCLCTLHPDYSFVPHWRPPFITALAAEDRCHLNGLAVVDGRPRYATARSEERRVGKEGRSRWAPYQ